MNHIVAIALNTYREAVRNKVFYILLAFALFLMGFSIMLAQLSLDQNIQMITHMGLFAINMFGLLLAMFIGVSLIYDELEKRTIYVLVAHGMPRYTFVLGKFLGLAATVAAITLLMTLLFALILITAGGAGYLGWELFFAVSLIYVRMLVVISLALLFSSFSTPILSAVLTLMAYIICNYSNTLNEVVNYKEREGEYMGMYMAYAIYAVVPDFSRFEIMKMLTSGHAVVFEPFLYIYGLVWTGFFLLLAIAGFGVRDFK